MSIRLSGTTIIVLVSTLLIAPTTSGASAAVPATASAATAAQDGTKVKVRAVKSASLKLPGRAPGSRHMGAVSVRSDAGTQLAYRLDPTGKMPKAIGAVTSLPVLDAATGSKATRPGTVAATAQAAYLVSEYGSYRKSRAQGAALELALNDLLQSKAWGVKGKKTAKRLRSSRLRLVVRKYARVMLAEARTSAGPYVVTVTGERVTTGQPSTLTATVASAAGTPMKGLDVDFAVAGAPAGVGTTTEAGAASARYTTSGSGVQEVTAVVHGLPDTQLRTIVATRPRKATRLAVMGAPVPMQGTGSLLAVATPVLELVPSTQQLAGNGATFIGGVRLDQVAPGGSPVTATVTLHGPFPTATGAAQACQSGDKAVGTVSGAIPAASGLQKLPGGLAVPSEGYYVYRVKIAGNEVNNPAEACGGAARAMRQPTIKVTQEAGPVVCGDAGCGRNVTVIFDVANLPIGYQGTLHVAKWKYTGAPDCIEPPVGTVGLQYADIVVSENGRYTFTYGPRIGDVTEVIASLSPHEWMVPTQTACGTARYSGS